MKLSYGEIIEKFYLFKSQGLKLSNMVFKPKCDSSMLIDCVYSLDSLVFWVEEESVKRGYFFSCDEEDLVVILKQCSPEIVFEYITKDKEALKDFFEKCGYENLMIQERISVSDITPFIKGDMIVDEFVHLAQENEVQEINRVLHETFDSRVAHLLNNNELLEEIKKANVYSYDKGNAVLQVKYEGIKLYINQIVNRTGKKEIIHSIFNYVLSDFISRGKKYVYAWVDENNIASIKFHEKYGMKKDGLYNLIWIKK